MRLALKTPLPEGFRPGMGLKGDFRDLTEERVGLFDAIITSPPFYAMRFDRPNWLRMWFCGWEEEDFHQQSLGFVERQQTRTLDCYKDLFQVCSRLLKEDGLLILHVGSGGKRNMAVDLSIVASDSFSLVANVVEDVRDVEQHGIRDKGVTTTHHFLFMRPR